VSDSPGNLGLVNKLTVSDSLTNWKDQVQSFLASVAGEALQDGWHATYSQTDVREEPVGIGATLSYTVPVLELSRIGPAGTEQRITLEPRHRFTIGATGRIDVYSHPALRDAMLLRRSLMENPEGLTWEEIETEIGHGQWKAYSTERLPLNVDLTDGASIRQFLADLVS